jgi:hypothetical protein
MFRSPSATILRVYSMNKKVVCVANQSKCRNARYGTHKNDQTWIYEEI